MSKKVLLILISLGLLVLAVVLYAFMRLPANRIKVAPATVSPAVMEKQVEKKIATSYPHAVISPGKSEKPGETIYEVRLPDSEARDLPRLHAYLSRVYAEYRQQGFKGRYLIYLGDRVIQSVP